MNMRQSLFILIIFSFNYSSLAQSNYNKIGGVCFRVDDDYQDPSDRLIPLINVFNARGLKFMYSVNFGIHYMTPALLSCVQQMQMQGFEIADHTPDHETRFFDIPITDTSIYQGLNGVDHIFTIDDYARVCLEWDHVLIDTYTGEGLINISGNTVTSVTTNEFTDSMKLPHTLDPYSMDAIYIPSLNKLFQFDPNNVTGNQITNLKSFWGEDINLDTLNGIQYHKVGQYDVFYISDAMRVLAKMTQQYCDNNGITRPTTWVQTGGICAQFYRADIKAAFEPMGYSAASVFADPVPKHYNSYDPNDDNRYGMGWEDFNEEIQSLAHCKKVIADNFARHHVSINQSHLASDILPLNTYLQKTANILDWCLAKGIPVKSYKEWAQLLYKTPQNPYVNVFPSVDVDLDADSHPDGFESLSPVFTDGVMGIFSKSFSINGDGLICNLYNLGGVEKGENYFGLWIKGDGQIEVYIRPTYSGEWLSNTFTSNGTNWSYHNCTFQIPDTCSEVSNVEIYSVNTSGTIRIGGFELRKNSSNKIVKVFMEGPYNGSTMNTSLNSQGLMPLIQPFNIEPWYYNGVESLASIPSDIVDWLLLDLRTGAEASSIISKRAAFLKSDGSIVDLDGVSAVSFSNVPDGNYYLAIHHRNHLSIMSASTLPFSNGSITTIYDFTTGQNKAYGTNPMVALSGGGFGMIAGDANNSGIITAADITPIIANLNSTIYIGADVNMSAIVTASDITKIISNLNSATNVPN
jgi:hypothetical protein